jgi:predicted nucleic acid-binding protein
VSPSRVVPIRRAFFDTKVALYLLSADHRKAGLAEDLLAGGGTISVQVLNEFASVARRKHQAPWDRLQATLAVLCDVCAVEPLTLPVHQRAVALAQQRGFTIHDATILASARAAGCDILYAEDLQHGQRIDDSLIVVNAFL